jgi:small-conductance mechanosensitive channel
MKRNKVISLTTLLIIFWVAMLATACGAEPAAPTPTATPTAAVLETDEAADAPAVGTLQDLTVEDLAKIVAERPPVPTPTPGPVDRVVKQVATESGLVGKTFLGLSAEDWINLGISVLGVLVGSLLLIPLLFGLLNWAVHRTENQFDDDFLATIGRELRWLVVIILAGEATLRLEFWSQALRTIIDDLFFLLTLAVLTIIGLRLVTFAADRYLDRLKPEADRKRWASIFLMFKRLGYLFVSMIALNIGLAHFGISITSTSVVIVFILAVIVIGARAAVTDIISGYLILADRPFQVGDDILIKELNTWGKVMAIGTRSTRMRVDDNREVIVPNSVVSESQVINYTSPDPSFRMQIELRVAYDTDINQLRQVITSAVRGVDGVLSDQPVDVFLMTLVTSPPGAPALQIQVRWWIGSYNAQFVMTDRVNTALRRTLRDAAIEIP